MDKNIILRFKYSGHKVMFCFFVSCLSFITISGIFSNISFGRTKDQSAHRRVPVNAVHCDTKEILNALGPDSVDNHIQITKCNTVWIKSHNLTMEKKLNLYNMVVGQLTQRALKMQERGGKIWKIPQLMQHFHGITVQKGKFLSNHSNFRMAEKNEFITSVYLLPGSVVPIKDRAYYTSVDFRSNTLIKDFFPCTTSGKSIEWSPARGNYSATCQPDVAAMTLPSRDMDPRFYSYHGWRHNFRDRRFAHGKGSSYKADWNLNCPHCHLHPNIVTYSHIIRNAVILDPAVVYQIDGKLKVLHLQCKRAGYSIPPVRSLRGIIRWKSVTYRNVVFTITNNWQGDADQWVMWHTFGEAMTRLAVYQHFLRANPHVAIHIKDEGPAKKVREVFLRHWNLTNEVVSGTLFAKVLILAEGNPCFQPGYLYLQTTQQLLANSLHLSSIKPDSILYIQRTFKRKIIEEARVLEILSDIAKKNNLQLNIFSDNAMPSQEEISHLFHRSYLTIGAHGAGLTNILFSTPRTAVLEIICEVSPGTFMHMSHKLGLRHHAFYGERNGYDRCDNGISIANRIYDFQSIVSQMLHIVLQDSYFKQL